MFKTGDSFTYDEIRISNPCDPVAESLGKCADQTRISTQANFQSDPTSYLRVYVTN